MEGEGDLIPLHRFFGRKLRQSRGGSVQFPETLGGSREEKRGEVEKGEESH